MFLTGYHPRAQQREKEPVFLRERSVSLSSQLQPEGQPSNYTHLGVSWILSRDLGGQAISSCFPSAILQWKFVQKKDLIHIWCASLYGCFPGYDPWLTSKARVSGPSVTVRDGETASDQLPSPGNRQTADWNTLPLLLWKKAIHLSWNSGLKARLVVWHDLGTCRGALRGGRPVGTSFVLCFFLAPGYWYLLERSVPTDWHHEFWGCHPGDTPRSPGYHIQLGWCSWPHRMVYICILEKLLPEGLASNELKSRRCLRSSPLGLTGLGTAVTKNKGHYKQIKPLGKWQPKARAGLNDNIHLLPRAITSRLKSYQAYFLTTIIWSKI